MRIPLSVDLAMHAVPAITLTLDFFLFEKRYTRYQVTHIAPLAAILFGLWYVSWVEYCASYNGRCTSSIYSVSGLPPLITNVYSSIPILGIPILRPRLGLCWGGTASASVLQISQLASFVTWELEHILSVSALVHVRVLYRGRVYTIR